MRFRVLFSFIFLGALLQGCSDSIKEKVGESDFVKNITKITILNKTNNKFSVDKIIINDAGKIFSLINELKKLKEIKDANLKANLGFYEIDIALQEMKTYEVDIVYTTYDGVVITDMSNKNYKNDNLEQLVLNYFQ